MELLGLLAHVDDVVLTEHLGGVSLVTTRSAEGLACNIQMDSDGFNLATNIQMDSDGFNLPSTVRWITHPFQMDSSAMFSLSTRIDRRKND